MNSAASRGGTLHTFYCAAPMCQHEARSPFFPCRRLDKDSIGVHKGHEGVDVWVATLAREARHIVASSKLDTTSRAAGLSFSNLRHTWALAVLVAAGRRGRILTQ